MTTLICINHNPVQHRDGKPPWCKLCGLDADFKYPVSRLKKKDEPSDEIYISPTNDWLQSFTGRAVFPLDITSEMIAIEDIAHSLSMQCRYNGHTREFYSVAEHCVHMSYVVPEEDALWALLHDGTEAYVGDLIRPVKQHLELFYKIENEIMIRIVDKYGLGSYEMPASVKEMDNHIIENERRALLTPSPLPWTAHGEPIEDLVIEAWLPERAKRIYLERFLELMEKK